MRNTVTVCWELSWKRNVGMTPGSNELIKHTFRGMCTDGSNTGPDHQCVVNMKFIAVTIF